MRQRTGLSRRGDSAMALGKDETRDLYRRRAPRYDLAVQLYRLAGCPRPRPPRWRHRGRDRLRDRAELSVAREGRGPPGADRRRRPHRCHAPRSQGKGPPGGLDERRSGAVRCCSVRVPRGRERCPLDPGPHPRPGVRHRHPPSRRGARAGHPWESVRRYLREVSFREFYFGALYLSVGTRDGERS
jgi:hypothetical protein